MNDMDKIYDALRKADAVGDKESARKLIEYIQSVKTKSTRPKEEPGLEQVPLLESFISPATAYTATLPVIKAVEEFGPPLARQIAKQVLPKTGTQMASQAAAAGASGVGGELLSRAVPEKQKQYKPLARTFGELGTGLGLGLTSGLGRGATPAIPRERIQSARYLKELGGKPTPEQISLGPQARPSASALTRQQGVSNRQYNKALGLPENELFGKEEFQKARQNANTDYNKILSGRKVEFDDKFFNGIQDLLNRQQSLSASGVPFGQSRALIGALEKIGSVPKNLQAKINSLPRIGEEEATADQSQKALGTLNELIASLRQQGKVQMDATNYNEIRSILGDAAARSSNNRVAGVFRKMQGLFDESADRSMPDVARDLENVRRRYETLKTLEEAQLMSGSEMGVIPAEAVGKAIQNRIEQGAIYGTNNPLYQLGQAGKSLSMMPPSEGRTFGEGIGKSLTKPSVGGVVRDLFDIPLYPVKKYGAARRLEEKPSLAQAATPTAVSLFDQPEERKPDATR